jgi:hypothetical protein
VKRFCIGNQPLSASDGAGFIVNIMEPCAQRGIFNSTSVN